MPIEYSIIESVYQTLTNDASLRKFLDSKKDIYKGFPSNDQKFSKNTIIVEPMQFRILSTNYISKTECARRFSLDISVFVGYTQETKQESLEKFLELTAIVSSAIDLSPYIASNTMITKIELIEIDKDFETDRLLFRQSEIKYEITGIYTSGNL